MTDLYISLSGFSDAFYKGMLELYTRENGRIIDRPKNYYVVDERALRPDGMCAYHFLIKLYYALIQRNNNHSVMLFLSSPF